MATPRNYLVSFRSAERVNGGFRVHLLMGQRLPEHAIEAASFADLERHVRALAVAYGQTCSPFIRLADKAERKPAGFDKFTSTLKIIDVPASVEA